MYAEFVKKDIEDLFSDPEIIEVESIEEYQKYKKSWDYELMEVDFNNYMELEEFIDQLEIGRDLEDFSREINKGVGITESIILNLIEQSNIEYNDRPYILYCWGLENHISWYNYDFDEVYNSFLNSGVMTDSRALELTKEIYKVI